MASLAKRPSVAARCVGLGLCAIVAFASGCGSSSGGAASLEGSVTLGGKPIPPEATAFITFSSTANRAMKPVSAKIADGKYQATQVPLGPAIVGFQINQPVGPAKISERTGKEFQEEKNLLPPKYAGGVPLIVEGDATGLDFNL